MNTLRKYLSLVLCVCLSAYALPSFAFSQASSPASYKVDLSDAEMDKAMGASGSVDVNLADYTSSGSTATAVFANRATVGVNYSLYTVDSNGNVLETLASGYLDPSTAILVSGTPTNTNAKYIQAKIQQGGVPGLEAKDSSWAP